MILKCSAQDVAAVGSFYDQTVLFLQQHINYPKWMYKQYPSVSSVCQAISQGTQFMCVEDGKVVGAFVFSDDDKQEYACVPWSENLDVAQYSVIHAFATHPTKMKQGIATQMLRYCIDLARSLGKKAIRLDVVPQNIPARCFYEKHGFQFVCEMDLSRGYEHIPTFCLYELTL